MWVFAPYNSTDTNKYWEILWESRMVLRRRPRARDPQPPREGSASAERARGSGCTTLRLVSLHTPTNVISAGSRYSIPSPPAPRYEL